MKHVDVHPIPKFEFGTSTDIFGPASERGAPLDDLIFALSSHLIRGDYTHASLVIKNSKIVKSDPVKFTYGDYTDNFGLYDYNNGKYIHFAVAENIKIFRPKNCDKKIIPELKSFISGSGEHENDYSYFEFSCRDGIVVQMFMSHDDQEYVDQVSISLSRLGLR